METTSYFFDFFGFACEVSVPVFLDLPFFQPTGFSLRSLSGESNGYTASLSNAFISACEMRCRALSYDISRILPICLAVHPSTFVGFSSMTLLSAYCKEKITRCENILYGRIGKTRGKIKYFHILLKYVLTISSQCVII